MKKFFFICVLVHLGLTSANASQDLFTSANALYDSGQYQQAIVLYDSLIIVEGKMANVYYNMGNAYYRSGEYGKALVQFERAHVLDPMDKDVIHNIQLLNKTKNKNNLPERLDAPFTNWVKGFFALFSVRVWQILGALFIVLGCFGFYLFREALMPKTKRWGFVLVAFSLGLFFLSIGASYVRHQHLNSQEYAVLIANSSYAKSAPDSESSDQFLLYACARVKILDFVEGWYKVRLSDGKEGWISADVIEII